MKAPKFLLVAIVEAAFVLASIGLANAGMSMDSDGRMSGCPLMAASALCHMSPVEHAFSLQNLLTTAAPLGDVVFALIAMLLVIVPLQRPRRASAGLLLEPLLRPPVNRGVTLPRHDLQEAFARGIVHSKAF